MIEPIDEAPAPTGAPREAPSSTSFTAPNRGPDARQVALGLVILSSLAIGAGYLSAFLPGGTPPWGPWVFMVGTSVIMVSTMALGASRGGRIGRLWIPLALVLGILVGGFGLVLLLPPTDPTDPVLWLGLPPRAAIVLYGIGLLPFLLVPVAYAWTFDELTLAEGDLERVRDAARKAREAAGPARSGASPPEGGAMATEQPLEPPRNTGDRATP